MVRNLILVLLAQILRHNPKSDIDLQPATDQFQLVGALSELLRLPGTISAGHVVAFDLQAVSVNLASIPLDEVLDFRKQNIAAHKKYVRSVRQFAREVSLLPPEERGRAFSDRQEELNDLANDLRRKARSAWRQPVSFLLGLAGACWTAVTNPLGGLLGGGALIVRGPGTHANEAGAFSYVFAAHHRFA
jgi:hypothetical protein